MLRYFLPIILFILNILFIQANSLPKEKNILVLHSYNNGLSWTDNINKGIFESFKEEYHRTVDLRVEYMDAKHFEDTAYFNLFSNFIARKYNNIAIDLIICADNAAFDFLSIHHNSLFENVPVVFCGLNYSDSIPKGFTGIMEDIDMYSNIATILKLHPDYGKLYFVIDKSITGRSIFKKLDPLINSSFPDLNFEYLRDYSFGELKTKLVSLQKNDIVVMLLFNFDRNGMAISYDIILDEITPYCKVPIYGVWDFYLGKGIVGGKITHSYQHGLKAASIAKEILNGKSVDEIPVISGPTEYLYDYKVLKKHGINTYDLPKEATIINLPYEFVLKNKVFFGLLAVILVLLISLIIILILINRKSKKNLKKEKELVSAIEKKSEDLKIALIKAEEANKLKNNFLSNISHEIRTPLNGILGFSELLSSTTDEPLRNEYADTINKCGNQLLNIINDILEISLIESNQIKLHEEVVNINKTLEEVMDTFNKAPKDSTIPIIINQLLNNDCNYAFIDRIKLIQILSNLLSNAIKFSNKGQIEIAVQIQNNQLLFSLKDEGLGIDPKYHALIFERFYQVEQPESMVYSGNGLGLSICKAYVEFMGGKIWVESKLGMGSTFYFTLPYKPSEKPAN